MDATIPSPSSCPSPLTGDATSTLDRRLLLGAAGLAGIAALASTRAKAGPLNPPAGPVASTGKTLTEVEPRTAVNAANTPGTSECIFRISQPGSYYLTGNITGVAGRRGIEIVASGVTLDLNGFSIQGVPGSGEGVLVMQPFASNITLRNGHVSGWAHAGVNFQGANTTNCRIENITATGNGVGIMVFTHTVVTGCIAGENTGEGFSALAYATFDRCTARGNTGIGFAAGNAARITDCTAYENGGHGVWSFSLGHVTGCSCLNNTGDGIFINDRNRVVGNYLFGNGFGAASGAGIHAGPTGVGANHIEGNTSIANDRGYHIESIHNLLIRNTAGDNTTRNWEIAANNSGLVIFAVLGPAVSGNSGGFSLASASYDPNANFTYHS